MKIKVRANFLEEILRNVIPILNYSNLYLRGRCVYLQVSKKGLSIDIDNNNGQFSYFVPPSPLLEVIKEGSVFLEGKNLYTLLQNFGEDIIEVYTDDSFCHLQSKKYKYSLSVIISDLPRIMKDMKYEDVENHTYNLPLLQERILAVKDYIALADVPALNGIYIGKDFMVASNRYMGAYIQSEQEFNSLEGCFLNEQLISTILNIKDNKQIVLYKGNSYYGYSGNLHFSIAGNEATFPVEGINKIFGPFLSNSLENIELDSQALSKAVRRLSILSSSFKKDEVQAMKLYKDKDKRMKLVNDTTNSYGEEEFECLKSSMKEFEVKFDGTMLKDCLKNFKEVITWNMGDSNAIFISDGGLTKFFAKIKE